jgi:hypothetical protein
MEKVCSGCGCVGGVTSLDQGRETENLTAPAALSALCKHSLHNCAPKLCHRSILVDDTCVLQCLHSLD